MPCFLIHKELKVLNRPPRNVNATAQRTNELPFLMLNQISVYQNDTDEG